MKVFKMNIYGSLEHYLSIPSPYPLTVMCATFLTKKNLSGLEDERMIKVVKSSLSIVGLIDMIPSYYL